MKIVKMLSPLLLAVVVAGLWVFWSYSNCLMGKKLDTEKSGLVETIKVLSGVEKINYAKSPFKKDKYNIYIVREDENYHATITDGELKLLEVAGIISSKLKPQKTTALNISIPIIGSIAAVATAVFLFKPKRKSHTAKKSKRKRK
jgi:hypothetical protein